MSYFSPIIQLAFHNFASAAVGMAVAVGLVRGIARRGEEAKGRGGNFWADLVRGPPYVLLPVCLVLSLLVVEQGVIVAERRRAVGGDRSGRGERVDVAV